MTLIGEAPGRTPGLPFDGRCGRFLERLTGVHPRSAFTCRNVLDRFPGDAGGGAVFPLREARKAASRIVLRGVVLLAGKRVAAAFGVRARYFAPVSVGRATVYVIPHPSGRNRWWNSPENRAMAAAFLATIIAMGGRDGL